MSLNLDEAVVFYLEDDISLNKSTSILLKRRFKNLHTFYNGKEALEAINSGIEPSLIISDINMPEINGIEFLEECRNKNLNMPAVFLTAFNDIEYAKKAINLGVKEYYTKPIEDFKEFAKDLTNYLEDYLSSKYKNISMDRESDFVVVIEDFELKYINEAFLNFLDFVSIDEFKKEHKCICELFLNGYNSYYYNHNDSADWINEILKLPQDKRNVLIGCKKTFEIKAFNLSITRKDTIFIISFHNVSNMIKNQLSLERKIIRDNLTEAFNREYFDQNIKGIIDHTSIEGKQLGIVIADIDFFKKVNDTYGHDIGDEVLKIFVQVLKLNTREYDDIIRWGGEEFMLLIKVKSIQELENILNSIKEKVSNQKFQKIDKLTASFGCTLLAYDEEIETAIKRADDALYKAKRNGRNRVCSL